MAILALAGGLAMLHQAASPMLWLSPDGRTYIEGTVAKSRMLPGTRQVRINGMAAYDFNGLNGGIHVGDPEPLRMTGSMTVSVHMNLRSYVEHGPGAQVLFRGDDRNGLDPYTMAVHRDGTISFAVNDEKGYGRAVTAEIPLGRWVHVLANFDADLGWLEMWVNGEMVGLSKTQWRPFKILDPAHAPGVSIGNVQNDKGPHNQPINGMIADLRLYGTVLRPKDLDGTGHWFDPPRVQ